jgi:sugar phosphate isomerase/epimerase
MSVDGVRLTYCGNVHPANDLDEWLESTRRHAVPIARAARAGGHEFGLGAWWNHTIARELAHDDASRRRVRDFLAAEGLPLWTLNVFPIGGFHDDRVKTAVYRPDWADERRVDYTLNAARAAALLAPEGAVVPLSTLPLGYGVGDLDRMAGCLARVARALAVLEADTGRRLVLAIEPEPYCICETTAEAADFLERRVFRGTGGAEEALRRHLGICVDLCHLAVLREEPLAAMNRLAARGIGVPKIQVSSCLELRDPAAHLDELLAFHEPRYLHQTLGEGGERALDLDEVRDRRGEFTEAVRLRTHFHLPVFWDSDGPLGSTRAELERVLPALPAPVPLLEVETYTWTVLDPSWRPDRDLVAGLLRELAFVRGLVSTGR